jgi:5'-nucleotidase
MPFEVHDKLVIAIASSALFSLDEADQIFRARGEDAYREYQRKHENDHLKPGIAFAFIQRLLAFNISVADAPVEVVLLSRNDPDTGLRVMNSIQASNLSITRAAFVKGRKPYRYIKAFCASLFLSANEQDVKDAVAMGNPAGLVMDSFLSHDSSDKELRIAFDFDGVLADDVSEAVFKEGGLAAFHQNENEQADVPCGPGPLHELLMKVAALQKREAARAKADPGYERRLRIAIVTARNAPAHKRVVTSLRLWGIEVDETFFLGGLEKTRILGEFKPHIFFDDQQLHLRAAAEVAPCVHVPFGVRNAIIDAPEAIDLMAALTSSVPEVANQGSRSPAHNSDVAADVALSRSAPSGPRS